MHSILRQSEREFGGLLFSWQYLHLAFRPRRRNSTSVADEKVPETATLGVLLGSGWGWQSARETYELAGHLYAAGVSISSRSDS
jgi:hypothetical protein